VIEVAHATKERPTGPVDRLKAEAGGLVGALTDRALSSVRHKVEDMTGRLTGFANGEPGAGLIAAATGARNLAEGKSPTRSMLGAGWAGLKEKVSGIFGRGKGKGRGKRKLKLSNIVESIDVGVPVRLAYDQWNQFGEFPSFMKKVETADRVEDTKMNWKAQVFWSHRTWESTIIDQRPDERIIWHSKGQKGHVDGAVSFHELGPNLTRIVLVLEYHPHGMFERTGNIWRAQGRRARLELKHFARYVMTNSVLKPDEIEGWRGVIQDSEVVLSHEDALDQEGRERGEQGGAAEGEEKGQQEPTAEAAAETEAGEEAEGEEERPEAPEREAVHAGDGHREAEAGRRRRAEPARTARERVPRQRPSDEEQPQRHARSAARGGSRQ
jgi:hypothetical protein